MENIGANDKVFFFRFRHHKAMVAAAAATAPTSQNTSFASTESYPYESFDETGYGLVSSHLCITFIALTSSWLNPPFNQSKNLDPVLEKFLSNLEFN